MIFLLFEYLWPEVHFPFLLCSLEGRFLSHANGLKLMLFHEFWDGCVHEHKFSHNVGHIYLVGNLVACLHVLLYLWPVRAEIDKIKEVFDITEDKISDIVGFWWYLFLVIVNHDLSGQTDLISLFGVGSHDEDESNDGPDQPSDIRKVSIKFIEGPFVFDSYRWFSKYYLGIE